MRSRTETTDRATQSDRSDRIGEHQEQSDSALPVFDTTAHRSPIRAALPIMNAAVTSIGFTLDATAGSNNSTAARVSCDSLCTSSPLRSHQSAARLPAPPDVLMIASRRPDRFAPP
jgi:hypothetical protein